MRCGTALVSCALCVASILGGAWMSRPTPVDYGPVLATASDMYAVTDAEGEPVRWYVVGKGGAGNGASADSGNSGSTDTDSANSDSGTSKVSRVPASAATLPWKVSVTYSLDGPNVEANEVAGASGLIGVYIDIKPQTKEANRTIPVVAFTVPTQVADDVSADNSITVTMQGSNTVVAAAGKAATGLEFSCYMNAKDFSMSSVALAVLPSNSSSPAVGANPDAANAAAQPAADTDVAQLTASAATLVDALTDAGSGEQQQLIEQLQTLRDNERALNKSVVAERETAHKRTFEDYMAAYVGSYTTHLSGSIGTSTQLPALMGTAGELSGDTPLAQAVLDLANAVNNVSAAHQHAGAVDALDEVIRRIQQQGTSGLVDDLTAEASEEATRGSKQYADGQSQLSAAMIPYSMKYTDFYTANLSALTGGTSSGATAYESQAIAETNGSDELADAQSKVDAAMSTLATASEHTGKATALRQIVLRFSDQFEGGTSSASGSDGDGSSGDVSSGPVTEAQALTSLVDSQSQSFYGKTRATQAKRKADAARKQAKAVQQQQSQHSKASLVDDTMSMSAGDVMNYAGGLTSAIGGGDKSDSSKSAGSGTNDSAKSSDTDDSGNNLDTAPVLFGFGTGGTLLKHDMNALINETVKISDAGTLLAQAVAQLDSPNTQQKTAETRYLIVIPTV
ncbi:hypothetical protein [Bifidobacterium longum]|uniref:Tubuliform spidroin n=2 Tax=Bifidobacterium longum subsp. infantis TaxID=1682 RepID=A0ABM9R216_BIFLI|nr:hypothetical protein [Bifidobacterium longum]ACJ51400.1 conserved hypothetical protein [Bifidobacterium longum subsp. infantis ATCC 15697 = JCM 1222 = DSM 20088]MBX4250717.1 hypothetical protein [Bifidobacterium longum subsp. infantis]MEE4091301.1 hypothetical protein [Bifidobacterium longum subsp. infantis]CEE96423.1 hypothetical protein BLIC_a00324 [Bifidobacterium longum subsp. infantis]CEE97552.1 hypothetical protein BLIC_b00326 [Bifidobacterium longum subsp. infantis]